MEVLSCFRRLGNRRALDADAPGESSPFLAWIGPLLISPMVLTPILAGALDGVRRVVG
jgi:hypothetical protein